MLTKEFQEGHYYLTVEPKLGKTKVIDCGVSEKDVLNQLDLLNDKASPLRQTLIKGFFLFENGSVIKCNFIFSDEKIIGIEKNV
ncbi:hypothetical protein MZM54_05230 [[Brevibacterium] frigoritolerans]|nr:hypothetical protein [Peribacillus frigoritolerans]